LGRRNLVLGLGLVFAALIMITVFYMLATVIFVEVNPVALVAAVSVAFGGVVWFRKTVKDD
jgi:hypothetical protein